MKKYTFEEIVEQNSDRITVSKENLEEILREAVDCVVNGGSPMEIDVARTTPDDHVIQVSWSYNGDHYYDIDIVIRTVAEDTGSFDWPDDRGESSLTSAALNKLKKVQRELQSKLKGFFDEKRALASRNQAEELSRLLEEYVWFADFYRKLGGICIRPIGYAEEEEE